MIVTKNTLEPGQNLTADLCIVGGGPAAISMALRLASSGQQIIVVAGGGWTETVANQDLYRGVVAPGSAHEPLEENRRRQFGGASAVWGGRCIPFDPLDFQPRPWVPDSGWPITYDTLLPYYHKAAELCRIGAFDFHAQTAFPDARGEIIAGLDSDEIVSYPMERWSTPVNFATTYRSELEQSTTIRVLLDAHALTLDMTDTVDRISSVMVSMEGKTFSISADQFVLAAGGIENPRLLLASPNRFFPSGLGNQHDNVGRYYMAHLDGTYAALDPADRVTLLTDFERDATGVYCRRRWWIPEPVQRANELLNIIFFLFHADSQTGHRDVLFSARYVAKSLLTVMKTTSVRGAIGKLRELAPGLREHTVNIVRNGFSQIPELVQLGLKRLSKRRLPFILPSKKSPYWGLYFQAEQRPNRESRVYLSASEKDAFGMPRAEVDIRFTDEDLNSVVLAHRLFMDNFRQKRAGEALYSEEGLRAYLQKQMSEFNTSAHHIGTTRMSDNPGTGVVDRDAKVHGLANLYIAGSSVFPTGGHANPTLTIVAHTLLLADHLKEVLAGHAGPGQKTPVGSIQTGSIPETIPSQPLRP